MSLPSPFVLPYHPVDDPTLDLHGYLYLPDTGTWGNGPYPSIIATHAGGFTDGGAGTCDAMLTDLQSVGYLCLFVEVRLAKENGLGGLNGQTTNGYYPQQTDDLAMGVGYLHDHNLCNGFVAAAGGSGSGNHAAWVTLNGIATDTKAEAAICLSGELDASDREADVQQAFIDKCELYFQTSNLTTLEERSPIHFVVSNQNPIYIANGQNEAMPYSVFTRFKAKMDQVGVTNYVAHVNTAQNGHLHSFATYTENASPIKTFLQNIRNVTIPQVGRAVSGGGNASIKRS